MKKKIAALLIAISSAFLAAGFAACDVSQLQPGQVPGGVAGYDLNLDLSGFNPVVGYRSEITYDTIKFNYSKYANGTVFYEAVIDAREDMVVSGGKTDTVGEHELVVSYAGEEFVIPYTVKYQVDFVAKGEIFDTQYVLESEEVVLPQAPAKNGYEFAYWKTEIPEDIKDNLSVEAHYYNTTLKVPTLKKIDQVYDSEATLSDLTLPSNKNGAWEFVDDGATPIGNVGENKFAVRFVPATDELPEKEDFFTVNVTPQAVTFTVENVSFVYDGDSHFPTCTPSKDVAFDVLGKAETDAGTYTFALLVTDGNYEGVYSGSYEIVKPDVTITVHSYSMKYGEPMPEIKYTVEGFKNTEILGIEVKKPNVNAIGEYTLDLTVANTNVNATVVKGGLSVAKGDLTVDDPVLSSDTAETPAIYESPISSVTLTGDYRGVWTWKDPTAIIDSVDSYTATAVFTPNNSNYNAIEREMTITNLDKRTLAIEVVSSKYTYTGNEYTIVYKIEDGKSVQVDGVLSKTNAGSYATTLSINDKYYKGEKAVTLVIDKATPATDFSENYTKVWNNFLTLSDITLPEGYTWDVPATSLDRIGTFAYAATFTPEDTDNYVTVSGTFTVTVEKAPGVLHGVKDSYTFTYNKDSAQTLSGITSTPAESTADGITIKYTYVLNGEEVSEMKVAGTYQVTIDLPESDYHTAASETTEVIINKVVNNDIVTLEQSAIYGALMSTLALPTNEFGTWSWEGADEDTTVGTVGEHTYVAVYTPNDAANYEGRKVNVSVTVTKQTVYEPTVQNEIVYTGSEITVLSVAEDALYTAEGDLKATNKGDYTITLTLKDSANYKWSGSSEATVEIDYAITQAPNAITSLSIEGWTYNDKAKTPVIKANFGAATAVYYYAPFGTQNYATTVPTTAGTYNLKAVIAETANYASAEKTVTSAFTIAKDTPVVVFDKHYTRTWYEGLKLSSISLEEGFAWKEDATLEVGAEQEFAVVYTHADTTNYNTVEGTFKVTVNRRSVSLNGVLDNYTHVYDGNVFEVSGITATPNVELVYTYSSGSAPVNAGEYTVTITLDDTTHYTFGTDPDSVVRTIVIEKADVDTVVSFEAVYGDKLGTLSLPTSELGVWSWKEGNDALVGDAGERSHVAVFTSTSANHNSLERAFTVSVAKQEISKPTLTENSFVYTGEAITVLGETDLYTVSGNSKTDVGEYTVTVTLKDSANYAWTAESVDPTFEITQATTEIKDLAIEGWTYGDEANAPTAKTNFGEVKYLYAGEDGVYAEEVPENAGNYFVKAYVTGNKNYTSDETEPVSFTIAKAEYTKELLSESYAIDWFENITLAAVENLPEGYAWTDSSVALTAGVKAKFGVTYVDPSENYKPAYGEFEVKVNKLGATLDVETTFNGEATAVYTHTYNGGAFVVTATASHTEKTPVYTVDGEVVNAVSLMNAGSYEVVITLAESDHYLAASWTQTVTIEKAKASYVLPTWNPSVDATMGDLAEPSVSQLSKEEYDWIWQTMEGVPVQSTQKVGEPAQEVTYKLYFASYNDNYVSFTIEVMLTVGKTIVSPTLENNSFEYTGEAFTVKVLGTEDVAYTINYVTDFTNVGNHTVELIMDAEAYKKHGWNGSTTDTISLPVTITASVNTVESVTLADWTFGETASVPITETKFGGEVTYTYYNVATPNEIEEGIPANAGKYVLIATSESTGNYASASKESAQFTIAQATPDVPFATEYTVDWFSGIKLANVTIASSECVWTDGTVSLNVGDDQKFTAVYTPTDKNYRAINVEIMVNVERATATVNGVAENGYTHTYDGNAYTLAGITSSHDEATPAYTYKLNGVEVAEIKGVGVYEVTITLEETDYYDEAIATTTVTVEQADNEWKTTPSMSKESWVYNTAAGEASAEAKFGGVIIEYRKATGSEYSSTMPTDAGDYFVSFRVEETKDYAGLAREEVPFTIEQATVTASLADDSKNFVYNNVAYTANVTLDVDVDYELSDNVQTNAGDDYALTVTLKNGNYKFANGTNQTTVDFSIAKASVTLGSVTTTNGKHDELAPSAIVLRTDNGTYPITIKYYYDINRDGEYANELSTLTESGNAGTYYVIAKVEGNNNYNGAETEPVEVKIAQADTAETLVQNAYEIEWAKGLTLSAITPTGTGVGTYAWVVENGTAAETALNAETYTAFKVKFTPKDKNYAEITVDVTVTVTAMEVTVPTAVNLTDGTTTVSGNPTYNGKAWTNADSEADNYTISATSATNANETITVTLTLKANRVWKDEYGTTEAKELTFTVQKAQNAITKYEYNATTGEHTLEATYYTADIVTYYYKVNGEFVTSLPTKPGTYDVTVVIAESVNYLGTERTFAEAVTLSQTSITPSVTLSGNMYTGEDITATVTLTPNVNVTITCDNGGVVNGNTITVVEAGTYTVTLTLSEDLLELYKWSDKEANVASTTRSFTILAGENGWADDKGREYVFEDLDYNTTANIYTRDYDGTASIVDETTAWVKYGTATITYYSVVNGVETQLADGEYPTNAGNYRIYFTVEEGNGYAEWSDFVELTINKLQTVISTKPTYTAQLEKVARANANGYNYATAPVVTVVDTTTSVAGTFTYGEITFNRAGGAESTYSLSFVPTDTTNYEVPTAVTVTINLIDVAYYTADSGATRTYYGSIEEALNEVSSGEVWVVPNATGKTINHEVVIESDAEVKSGVTLIIPYGTKGSEVRNTAGISINPGGSYQGTEADASKRSTYVVLGTGATLIVNGTMEIAGDIGCGGSGTLYAGQTYGNYAELGLQENATVETNGVLNLTGFISGASGKVVTNNGSTIYMPFAYLDHHGGSYLTKLQLGGNNLSPFNRYQFRNIRNATLRMNYGSAMKIYGNLYNSQTDGYVTHGVGDFVGKENSGAAIQLLTEYSYLTAVFDPNNTYPGNTLHNGGTTLKIYGSAQMLEFKLSIDGFGSFSSADFDFPIPNYYDISLNKVEGNSDAKNGQYTMKNTYKLLPGSKFTVEKGATLNVDKMIVYTEIHETATAVSNTYYDYKVSKEPAKMTVNGTLIAANFGGIIYTEEAGAKVQITSSVSVTTYEVVNESGGGLLGAGCASQATTKTLQLPMSHDTREYYTAKGTYYSNGTGWYPENVTITFSANGSTYHTVSGTSTTSGYVLSASDIPADPTRTHYTFSHWCLTDGCTDENCEGVSAGDSLYGNVTLYAAWTADEYTMKFMNVYDDTTAQSSVSDVMFTADTESIPLTTPNAPIEGYNFSGWYTAVTNGTKIDSIIIADYANLALNNGGSVTIYAYWTGETTYDIVYQVAASAKGNSISTPTDGKVKESETGAFNPIAAVTAGTAFTDVKETMSQKVYFDGWYTDSGYTTKWSAWNDSLLNGGTLTLYGRWIDKYEATFDTSTNVGNATTATIATVYLYAGQSYDLSSYVTTFTANNAKTNITRYFNGWTVTSGSVDASHKLTLTGDSTVTAVWSNKASVKAGTVSNASIKVNGVALTTEPMYYEPGAITFAISYTESNNKTFSISGGASYSGSVTSYNLTVEQGKSYVASASSEGGICLVEGTLITLADGTQKRIEDLVAGDMLLTFNHFTGEFEMQPLLFNIHTEQPAQWYRVANLQFSNGKILKIGGYHGIFDITVNEYAYISIDNMQDYIGHVFYQSKIVNGEAVGCGVTLDKAWVTEEYVKIFSPMTANNINCVAEDMLTSTPRPWGDKGYQNHMKFGEGLKYDEIQLQKDIETYGLFTYEELSDYIPDEVYEILPFKYLKIAIGKGYMTYEELLRIFEFMVENDCI